MNSIFLAFAFLAFGICFGFLVQKAGFCISFGFGEIFSGKGKRFLRMMLVVIIISTIGFFVSSYINPSLGLKPIGELRGFGFWNLASGFLFGAGISVAGGCILGTLRQLGEGNIHFLIVLLSFIPGMYLVVNVLNPILKDGYGVKKIILPDIINVPDVYIMLTMVALFTLWWLKVQKKKK
jgi:uncharacterized membrane protein YedE/YeeE